MDADTAECSSGEREKCRARRQTTTLRRSDVEVAELPVKDAKPAARENGKLKRAAELIVFLGRVEQATAEHGLVLMWPFIPPLVCERAPVRPVAGRSVLTPTPEELTLDHLLPFGANKRLMQRSK